MRFLILTACLAAVLATACHDDEVCNPGLELKAGVCVPPAPTQDAGGDDGGMPDASTSDAPDDGQ
jgi:hypothetical protein